MAERMFRCIGPEDLIRDPRFETNDVRVQNVEALDAIVGDFIRGLTLTENLAFFERAEVTVGPIYDAMQLLNDPHVRARLDRGSA